MNKIRQKIRILFLASGDLWAGAEAVIYELIRGLSEHPYLDVSIILLNDGRLAELSSAIGLKTFVIDEEKHSLPGIFVKTASLVRKLRPDIIHAHRYKENILAFLIWPYTGRPRLVSTIHGLSEIHAKDFKSKAKDYLNLFVLKIAFDKIVAVSNDIANHINLSGRVPAKKISKIYNGLKVLPVDCIEKPLAGDRTIKIGSAGRLYPVKDYPCMVEIARLVCKQRSDVNFYLAGDGPEISKIKELIKLYGLEERFILLGHVVGIGDFYKEIDIFINTSFHEGIPMSVLEAMSYKRPIIAFDVGGFKEIVDDDNDGFLIKERNVEAFSATLLRFVDEKDLIHRMGEKAREKVIRHFSTDKMVQEYVDLYASVLKNS